MESETMRRVLRRVIAVALAAGWAGAAAAYPGGAPDFQTNVTPFCAACHASLDGAALDGAPADRARGEVADAKHLAAISSGAKAYAALSATARARLVELVRAVDANANVELDFPPSVAPGETFQVTLRIEGGSGPVVGAGLVDRAHRWYAKSADTVGWKVVGAPTVIGPGGQPQSAWLGRRPERLGRDVTYVDVVDWKSDAEADKWAHGKVIWTLRAPSAPGDYALAGFFLYGTEKAVGFATTSDPNYGEQPLGGYTGRSGRVRFTAENVITVK